MAVRRWQALVFVGTAENHEDYHVEGCQNYDFLLRLLNTRRHIILRSQTGTIILTASHVHDEEDSYDVHEERGCNGWMQGCIYNDAKDSCKEAQGAMGVPGVGFVGIMAPPLGTTGTKEVLMIGTPIPLGLWCKCNKATVHA